MKEFEYKGTVIQSPADLRKLKPEELPELCLSLREYIAGIPTDKPAHLESSLGATELTVALHYLFQTPEDALIWDVGHQTAAHKVLTGRGGRMYQSLRRLDGVSGFPLPEESEYDLFQTGHSSTSISMALGLWLADQRRKVVAVIGDGALTGGQAYEALNIAGGMQADLLVIFNDNNFSIEPNVGALSQHNRYNKFFSALNFQYFGPIDGNDILQLIKGIKEISLAKGPRILHVKTLPQRLLCGKKSPVATPVRNSLRAVLEKAFDKHSDLYLLSPAMLSGGGFIQLRDKYPDRIIDTGITEQACTSIAAGLAKGGKKVFVHLYSTFLHRAYDQIVHDVALQRLPVLFLVDRAGLVGEDGPTHHGLFDLPALMSLPDFEVYQPADVADIGNFFNCWTDSPHLAALRIPRDSSVISDEILYEKISENSEICLIATGFVAHQAIKAFNILMESGYPADFRILKRKTQISSPDFLSELTKYKKLFLVEEAYLPGSFSQMIISEIALASKSGAIPNIVPIVLEQGFVTHGRPEELLSLTGFETNQILTKILFNLDYK